MPYILSVALPSKFQPKWQVLDKTKGDRKALRLQMAGDADDTAWDPEYGLQLFEGVRADPAMMARRARKLSKHKLYDGINGPWDYSVSQAFVDLVEELEPGVHQWLRWELEDADGEPIETPIYAMNICNRVDAIRAEESTMTRIDKGDRDFIYGYMPPPSIKVDLGGEVDIRSPAGRGGRFCVDAETVDGMALWADMRSRKQVFCSDALWAGIEKRKLKGFDRGDFGVYVEAI